MDDSMIDVARDLFRATRRWSIKDDAVSLVEYDKFKELAEIAQETRAFKSFKGEFGTTCGVFLGEVLMMVGIFNEEGDLECYQIT